MRVAHASVLLPQSASHACSSHEAKTCHWAHLDKPAEILHLSGWRGRGELVAGLACTIRQSDTCTALTPT